MTEVLRLTNVSRTFGPVAVLADVNLTLTAGERLAVLGSSGSGKTTLLRLVAGLDAPTTGEVAVGGRVASLPGRLIVPPEGRDVALVFQGLALFPHLRALDQIAFAARGRGGVARARELLARVGLGHRAEARLDHLSGGERQRVALARALAQEPRLLLVDEPFASLDDERRADMRDLLRSLLDESGTTLVMVTHDRADALDLARRVLVVDRGRAVVDGELAGVLANPRHAAAVKVLGLGQVVQGEVTSAGRAETAFGPVRTTAGATGRVLLLVRPGQPRLGNDGVAGVVTAVQLRPTDGREVRRLVTVGVGGQLLRAYAGDGPVAVGDAVAVRIDGECEVVAGAAD